MPPAKYLKTMYTEDMDERLTRTLQTYTRRLADVPVCDFCGDTHPVVIYGANRMTTGEPIECWRWCACSECEKIVDTNQWGELRERIVSRLKKMLPSTIPEWIIGQAVLHTLGVFFRDATLVESAKP